jgi:hypothetical protein
MENTGNQGQNQPKRDDQVKGGQHSQQGGSSDRPSKNVNENDQRSQSRPGNEAPVKGGQPSRNS